MLKKSKTYILNDQPTEEDALDFTPYVETLVDIIQTGNTPLTIGVFGTWGSGKTSLMRMVKKKLPKKFAVSWFDAWKYDKEETLWRVLLLQVLSEIRAAIPQDNNEDLDEINDLEFSLYAPVDREKVGGMTVEWGKMGQGLVEGALQIGLGFLPGGTVINDLLKEFRNSDKSEQALSKLLSSVHRESTKIHIEQIRFLEQFHERFTKLVNKYIVEQKRRLVLFVDDLDRCSPEKAIEVLEAIKLFLDASGSIFVLGVDQDVIARGIEMKYKEFRDKGYSGDQARFTIEGLRYLEKIIQLPFQIPPIDPVNMKEFISSLSTEWPNEDCPSVFDEGLGDNPRQIKRSVNTFLMLWKLADRRKAKLNGEVKPIRLAKVVAIQAVHPTLYDFLREEPRYLGVLEEYYRAGANAERSIPSMDPSDQLVPFLSHRAGDAVRRILLLHNAQMQDANFAGLSPDELRLYFTLTRSAETPQILRPVDTALSFYEPQMINIPTGKFLMGSTDKQTQQIIEESGNKAGWMEWVEWEKPQHFVELSEYFISKFPITNREYQAFVKSTKCIPPRGWEGDQFPPEKGGHPVVYVSWNDAVAYCIWLSEKSGKQYRLPTEAEWEKAARWYHASVGEEKSLIWAWGDEFDPSKANTVEARKGTTSSVGDFSPQGDSPYGCVDMIGNVWEWCNDWFDEQEYKRKERDQVKDPLGPSAGTFRVLRGGSFDDGHRSARGASRDKRVPHRSNGYDGFRIAYSPMKLESND
jgi:Uncharacterized conserved protein